MKAKNFVINLRFHKIICIWASNHTFVKNIKHLWTDFHHQVSVKETFRCGSQHSITLCIIWQHGYYLSHFLKFKIHKNKMMKLCHLWTEIIFFIFQFWCIFFPFIIALDKTSNTMLIRTGKSGNLFLILDLREKAFFAEYDINTGFFI